MHIEQGTLDADKLSLIFTVLCNAVHCFLFSFLFLKRDYQLEHCTSSGLPVYRHGVAAFEQPICGYDFQAALLPFSRSTAAVQCVLSCAG